MRILVSNCHTRIGHSVGSSLARLGHQIIAAGTRVPTMMHGAENVAAEVRYPDPFLYEEDFLETITRACCSIGVDTIVPVHEEIFVLALHRASFAPVAVIAPGFAELMEAQDKLRTFERAMSLAIPTPRTLPLSKDLGVSDAAREIGLPLVIKPRFGSGASGVVFIRDRDAVDDADACIQEENASALIAQEWVGGVGAGVGVLVWDGKLAAVAGHKRLREIPISGGTSTARISYDSPPLIEAAGRALAACALNGVAMVEFRVDETSGRYWLLEINPRYWGGMPTGIAAGVNFPAIHWACATGQVPPATIWSSRKIESRWVLGEIRAAFESLQRGEIRRFWKMFQVTPGATLSLDDLSGRWGAGFIYQTLAYLSNAYRYGNLGGHSQKKTTFFERHTVTSGLK